MQNIKNSDTILSVLNKTKVMIYLIDIEKWLPFLLGKSYQITSTLMRTALSKFNLTPPQFATLAFLWRNEGINLNELGTLISVDRTTIGEIVNRLEKLGYIRKQEDPKDRRSTIISVTDRGLEIQAEVVEELNGVKNGLDQRLSKEEQDQLIKLLTKFRLSLN